MMRTSEPRSSLVRKTSRFRTLLFQTISKMEDESRSPVLPPPTPPFSCSPRPSGSYYMFHLKNREFSFDVDVSKMPCGLNGALYFVQMDQDGGKAKYSGNEGGAKYGTGYCDAQCPHDLKFINGEPNLLDWHPSATDPNAGNVLASLPVCKFGVCVSAISSDLGSSLLRYGQVRHVLCGDGHLGGELGLDCLHSPCMRCHQSDPVRRHLVRR